jgi:hypothetical protein
VRLGVGVAARLPFGAPWRLEAALTGAVRIGRLEIGALAGGGLSADQSVPMSAGKGTLTLRMLPARLSLGWPLALGRRLALVPALAGGFDLVIAETHGIDMTRRSSALEPIVEAGVRAVLALTRRVWVDLQAFQGVDIRPEQFTVQEPGGDATVFVTPRTYTRLGVDFGVYFGKN